MTHKIRRTMVIGMGSRGAAIADQVARALDERTTGLPMVHVVAIGGEAAGVTSLPLEPPAKVASYADWQVAFNDQLETLGAALAGRLAVIHQVNVPGAEVCCRYPVDEGPEVAVYLVVPLAEPVAGAGFIEVAYLMQHLTQRRANRSAAVTGILLLPGMVTGTDEEVLAHTQVALSRLARHMASGSDYEPDDVEIPLGCCQPFDSPFDLAQGQTQDKPFNAGCYLVDAVNEDGLSLGSEEGIEIMIAEWILQAILTPMELALDRASPATGGPGYGSLGLACWRFPARTLAAHLSSRLQRAILSCLLGGDVENGHEAASAFLCSEEATPLPWPDGCEPRFHVNGEQFSRPALPRLASLRAEIDAAVSREEGRLRDEAGSWQERLEEALVSADEALRRTMAGLLDSSPAGGLSATEAFLEALEQGLQKRVPATPKEVARHRQRVQEMERRVDEAGRALDKAIARFPPWKLAPWLRVLFSPWRYIPLLMAYRRIEGRAAVYLAYRLAQWWLMVEALRRDWQVAFHRQLIELVKEYLQATQAFRSALQRLREALPQNSEAEIARLLEEAALPPALARHFYTRAVGEIADETALVLDIYGPLSRWLLEEMDVSAIGEIIAEHAAERFAFLDEIRLDELLIHTYSGDDLRAMLEGLINAARPFWACDETEMDTTERARVSRHVLVGLPAGTTSPLADLLPPRGVTGVYPTTDDRRVVVVQVRRGLSLRTLFQPPILPTLQHEEEVR